MSRVPLAGDGSCVVCGKPAVMYDKRVSFCGSACQSERVRYPEGRPKGRNCISCGVWLDFTVVGPGGRKLKVDTYKCRDCRRPLLEAVSIEFLVKRDGSDCSICKKPVDLTIKWPDRWSPSRDHVIPWSLGGSSSPENTALAHLRCNIQKQNKLDYVHPEAA